MAPYLLPLLAAVCYTVSALFIKKALSYGAGSMRTVFLTNWLMLPCFLPLLFLGHTVLDWGYFDTVVYCSFFNTIAMVLVFITIKVGDISLQTPVMGVKVIMVALLALVMGVGTVSKELWIGSGLTVIAIYILSKPDRLNLTHKRTVWLTILLSLLTSFAFAVADLIMAKYAVSFGEMPFILYVMLFTAVFSCVLIPYFEGSLRAIPRVSWLWIGLGSIAMALECIFYCYAVACYNNPTSVNILYSSRGIWSVVLVWLLGKRLGNTESEQGRGLMLRRLVGSFLLFLAIVIVVVKG